MILSNKILETLNYWSYESVRKSVEGEGTKGMGRARGKGEVLGALGWELVWRREESGHRGPLKEEKGKGERAFHRSLSPISYSWASA